MLTKKLDFLEFFSNTKQVFRNLLGFWNTSIAEVNKTSYNSLYRDYKVDSYTLSNNLTKPEQVVLDLLKTKPRLKALLDIGVGGGRTTKYFAEVTKKYIGIDYSENMIKSCRETFQNIPNSSFAVLDARNLIIYPNDYFDFVLFSHGGLDAVENDDRIRILEEIRRVSKDRGYFFFSTANLDSMSQFCQMRGLKNPELFAKEIIRIMLIRLLNPEMWKYIKGKRRDLEHTMFIVGHHGWNLKTYCITPQAQIKQLKEIGFGNIRIYDSHGKEIADKCNITDFELHFLCETQK